ncbi:MAG TPA: glycosyltransferase family 2 protein [Casimicrobiaceae bacterium]
MLPSSLQVSIVTYRPDLALLERTLDTLGIAIEAAQDERVLNTVHLALIDNSADRGIAERVTELGRARFAGTTVHVMYLHGHANIGYGAAHNLVLHGTGADYHLVLNPDAELAADALVNGIRWLDAHPDVGALAPAVIDAAGNRQYPCKRYPAIFDLWLRGFAPNALRRLFARRLARYEMREIADARPPGDAIGVPIISGAFMLARRDAIDRTGGFDPRFFLYFEDFDWSVRLAEVARNAFVPSVTIVHHGGGAARKGWRHVRWFVASGVRFYAKHGWKWL